MSFKGYWSCSTKKSATILVIHGGGPEERWFVHCQISLSELARERGDVFSISFKLDPRGAQEGVLFCMVGSEGSDFDRRELKEEKYHSC